MEDPKVKESVTLPGAASAVAVVYLPNSGSIVFDTKNDAQNNDLAWMFFHALQGHTDGLRRVREAEAETERANAAAKRAADSERRLKDAIDRLLTGRSGFGGPVRLEQSNDGG
jgi:hypothetical protein